MSKKTDENYKKYLNKNFMELIKCVKDRSEYRDNNFTDILELKAFNNIIGSLLGVIDGKGNNKVISTCRDFVLDYYDMTCPFNQSIEIDNAIYYKDCYQYLQYVIQEVEISRKDLEKIREFSKAYLKGFNYSKDISLESILRYYANKIEKYILEKNKLTEKEQEYILH